MGRKSKKGKAKDPHKESPLPPPCGDQPATVASGEPLPVEAQAVCLPQQEAQPSCSKDEKVKSKGPSLDAPASSLPERSTDAPTGQPLPKEVQAVSQQEAKPSRSKRKKGKGKDPSKEASASSEADPPASSTDSVTRQPLQEVAQVVCSLQQSAQPSKQQATETTSDASPPKEDLSLEVVKKFASLMTAPERGPFAPKPGKPGVVGQPIQLVTNCYEIIYSGNVQIHYYDVDIKPARTRKPPADQRPLRAVLNRAVMKRVYREAIFRGTFPAYDDKKNLFVHKMLPFDGKFVREYEMPSEPGVIDKAGKFSVHIQYVGALNLAELQALYRQGGRQTNAVPYNIFMALDIIFRQGPKCLPTVVPVERSFFSPQGSHPLFDGKELWSGYYQSVRPGEWKPIMVIDKVTTVFYPKMPVLNFIEKTLGRPAMTIKAMTPKDIMTIKKELMQVEVEVKPPLSYRRYRIIDVTQTSAMTQTFKLDEHDGSVREVSIADFFMEKYKQRLHYPNFPCLRMHPPTKTIYLPLEFCNICEKQRYRARDKTAKSNLARDMIQFSALDPVDLFREINGFAKNHIENSKKEVFPYGIHVNPNPMEVNGRVLPAPQIQYSAAVIQASRGEWDFRDKKFLQAARISRWVIVSIYSKRLAPDKLLQDLGRLLIKVAAEHGMTLPRPYKSENFQVSEDPTLKAKAIAERFRKYKGESVELAFVVFEEYNKFFREVKQAGDVNVGLVTQCTLREKLEKISGARPDFKYLAQLLLKINAKMGGQNNTTLPTQVPQIIRQCPVIIIGVDVSHPAPTEKSTPSIAAAVCSTELGRMPSRYAAVVSVQRATEGAVQFRVECIKQFEDMMIQLLKAFHKNTGGVKPQRIIIYRDGVSEGQFSEVLDELHQVRRACSRLPPLGEYKPQTTFIVCQKRHHIKFKPKHPNDGVGRGRNVPPGTVIDSEVIHPKDFNFFLCSHAGLKGTSKACHYTVLHDDSKYSVDELQDLTYHLCHVYARCTRSISSPAPVRYADLVAGRARYHLPAEPHAAPGSREAVASGVLADMKMVEVNPNLKLSMYFV